MGRSSRVFVAFLIAVLGVGLLFYVPAQAVDGVPDSSSVSPNSQTCDELGYVVAALRGLKGTLEGMGLDIFGLIADQPLDVGKLAYGQALRIPCPHLVTFLQAEPEPVASAEWPSTYVLGHSTQGRPIEVYRFGVGPVRLALVGGIHGGYEWNTIQLAYQMIDYFARYPDRLSNSVSLFIVPSANPDGQAAVVGHAGRFSAAEVRGDTWGGRFNARQVDLNRNWGCDWHYVAYWRDRQVNAGKWAFSEEETRHLSRFFTQPPMDAVLFWHSAVPGVFPGACGDFSAPSEQIAVIYGKASAYPYGQEFDYYPITGDASNWLASRSIPAITVELKNHTDTDWNQNLAGVLALIEFFVENGH